MFEGDPRVRRAPHIEVAERVVGGQTLLVPIRSSPQQKVNIFTLNDVGGHVWTVLREGATVSALAEGVAREFDVDVAAARRDVEAFLGDLHGLGLIEATPA